MEMKVKAKIFAARCARYFPYAFLKGHKDNYGKKNIVLYTEVYSVLYR